MAYLPIGVFSTVTKTANYTITVNDYFIKGDTTSNALTFTLPTAVGLLGKEFIIKNVGVKNLTVAANGAETIDGTVTKILSNKYASINIVSDNVSWNII